MKKDLDSIILTRQELEIMKVVWDRGAAKVGEVYGVISHKKQTAYTTVLTLTGILEEKGALTHVRAGRAYVYEPLLSREQATRNQICDVINRFFEGKPEKLLENVVELNLAGSDQLESVLTVLKNKREREVA
jgi:BlaI family transcriptional regulator, penicillinase repressor